METVYEWESIDYSKWVLELLVRCIERNEIDPHNTTLQKYIFPMESRFKWKMQNFKLLEENNFAISRLEIFS